MEEFSIIYRILRELRNAMDCEEEDPNRLSEQRLKTTQCKRDAILRMLMEDGYIAGLDITAYVGDTAPQVRMPPMPRITLKGLEYLEENNMMKKVARTMKGIREML